jgi:hypothetical protein
VKCLFGRLGRWVHAIVGVTLAGAGWSLVERFPGLIKDAPTTFSTGSAILTLFGVIFAIIEVMRIESSAKLAADAASEATAKLNAMYATRNATECLNCIRNALQDLDDSDVVGSSALARVLDLYAGEFATALSDEGSDQRDNVSVLQSYVLSYRSGSKTKNGRLRQALLKMTTDLSKVVNHMHKTSEVTK